MNRELLLQLQARHEQRLTELRGRLERNEVREPDLTSVQEEIDGLIDELQGIKDELADDGTDGDGESRSAEGDSDGEGAKGSGKGEDRDGENSDGTENRSAEGGQVVENRDGMITQQQRDGMMNAISQGLQSRARVDRTQRTAEVRKVFGRYVVGQATEAEARALGIVSGNGIVTVPREIVPEIISYALEANPLRTDGQVVHTPTTQGYPILVKKAKAYGHKDERGTNDPIADSTIEFDEIELKPTEFDALALVTKKLMYRSDLPVEDIVMEELGKAYAEKEAIYFFRGDETGNINPGSLSKKAVQVYATKEIDDNGTPKVVAIDGKDGPEMFDALVDVKNSAKASVRRRSKWYLNDAAIAVVEKMKDREGRPLYKPLDQLRDGVDGRLLNYDVTVTEYVDKSADDTETPIFYFGDFKSFKIQDVIGSLEVQRLVEKYSDTNHIGLKIYNLLDGQLIYSPLEPTMFKLELGVLPQP